MSTAGTPQSARRRLLIGLTVVFSGALLHAAENNAVSPVPSPATDATKPWKYDVDILQSTAHQAGMPRSAVTLPSAG